MVVAAWLLDALSSCEPGPGRWKSCPKNQMDTLSSCEPGPGRWKSCPKKSHEGEIGVGQFLSGRQWRCYREIELSIVDRGHPGWGGSVGGGSVLNHGGGSGPRGGSD